MEKRFLYQQKIQELLGGILRVPSGSCFSHSLELAGYFESRGLLWEIALGHELLEDTELDEEQIKSLLTQCGYSWLETNLITNGILVLTNLYTKVNYPQFNRNKRKSLEHQRISQIPPTLLGIKLQDRLLNLRDIMGLSEEFQEVYKGETLELVGTIGDNPNEDVQLKITQLKLALIKNN